MFYVNLLTHLKQSFARSTFKFIIIIQPILYSLLLLLMSLKSSTAFMGEYIVISAGIMTLWSSIIFSSAGDIERERFMGTLESIYSSPTDFRLIMLGKVSANVVLGMMSMIISYLFISILFNIKVQLANPMLFFLSFLLSIVSFILLSLLLASLFTLSKKARLLMNCLEYPIYILCGIVFPLDLIPVSIRWIGYILSPTWSVELLRMTMTGAISYKNVFSNLTALIVLSLLYLIAILVTYKKVDKVTRINGKLGVH
ncbi:ABC transporter permease [Bacillus aquiflavi]|uniref:ABC transporter permease n=1 Tax=Bacillus aquiflavi TaxID=2672567 RepID=UPI001CA9FAA1|nr:ABC transporter permease [Bacillus aquiflavi]UAC48080.1 ABC transporter permease [Bacillus aquiflavi]